jgi:hypothetical protein
VFTVFVVGGDEMGSDSFAPLAQFVSRGINPLEFFQAAVDRQQCNVDGPVRRRKQ